VYLVYDLHNTYIKISLIFAHVVSAADSLVEYAYIVDVSVGVLTVSASFPLIFLRCFACADDDSMWGHLMYYSPFIAIFQFGWASMQIAHMALMSQLTQDRSQRIELNGLR